MLSARNLFQEILDDDESFALFCSIAAGGESQGGWENGRIAALVPDSQRALAPKITRHGADEDKHGRIFNALMRKRGLEPVPVPPETDYTMLLEKNGRDSSDAVKGLRKTHSSDSSDRIESKRTDGVGTKTDA